jgi:hypothetical protein
MRAGRSDWNRTVEWGRILVNATGALTKIGSRNPRPQTTRASALPSSGESTEMVPSCWSATHRPVPSTAFAVEAHLSIGMAHLLASGGAMTLVKERARGLCSQAGDAGSLEPMLPACHMTKSTRTLRTRFETALLTSGAGRRIADDSRASWNVAERGESGVAEGGARDGGLRSLRLAANLWPISQKRRWRLRWTMML